MVPNAPREAAVANRHTIPFAHAECGKKAQLRDQPHRRRRRPGRGPGAARARPSRLLRGLPASLLRAAAGGGRARRRAGRVRRRRRWRVAMTSATTPATTAAAPSTLAAVPGPAHQAGVDGAGAQAHARLADRLRAVLDPEFLADTGWDAARSVLAP